MEGRTQSSGIRRNHDLLERYPPWIACGARTLDGHTSGRERGLHRNAVLHASAARMRRFGVFAAGADAGCVFAANRVRRDVRCNGFGFGRPLGSLEGERTQLSDGHGVAVGADGTTYVLDGLPVHLQVFPPGATGNVAPARTVPLPSSLQPEYTSNLALDGRGNFWIADKIGARLLRFALSSTSAKPNAAISPQVATQQGIKPARVAGMGMDGHGDVYCSCSYVDRGNATYGVSQYRQSKGAWKLVRSFYSHALPELPPDLVAIDGSGNIYLASPVNTIGSFGNGVFVFAADTRSGNASAVRVVRSGDLHIGFISTIAIDASGNLFVGYETDDIKSPTSHIATFAPDAGSNAKPLRLLEDKTNLHYGAGIYGNLLIAR